MCMYIYMCMCLCVCMYVCMCVCVFRKKNSLNNVLLGQATNKQPLITSSSLRWKILLHDHDTWPRPVLVFKKIRTFLRLGKLSSKLFIPGKLLPIIWTWQPGLRSANVNVDNMNVYITHTYTHTHTHIHTYTHTYARTHTHTHEDNMNVSRVIST